MMHAECFSFAVQIENLPNTHYRGLLLHLVTRSDVSESVRTFSQSRASAPTDGLTTLVPVFDQEPQLIQRFRAGQRDALARVYRFYFDDVYRLGQHGFVTGDGRRGGRLESDADRLDFVQDVFLKAFAIEARLSYDPQRPFRPFLLRIARNLRVDLARRVGREPSAGKLGVCDYLQIDELIERGGAIPALDASLHCRQLVEQTASIVAGLSPEMRDVARLRFVEELSQVEVASQLGKTRRHVRTLEGRLLQSLRKALVRAGFGSQVTEK